MRKAVEELAEKWAARKIEGSRLCYIELLLDEADRAAKETDVRYTHEEIILSYRKE